MNTNEITYKGYQIKIEQDLNAESPDSHGNNDTFIVYDHRQFYVKRKGFNPREIFEHIQQTGRNFYQGYHVYPLYAYIHSGVALSLGKNSYPFTCNFDTSMTGSELIQAI